MKYQVTCTIDDSLLAPVVELMAPYGRVVVRLVEGEKPKPTAINEANIPKFRDKLKRRVPAFMPKRGMGRIIALRLVAKGVTVAAIKTAYKGRGLSPNGVGANLSKLKRDSYVRRVGKGLWQLTPKGENTLRRLDAGATTMTETANAEEPNVAGD